MLIKFKNWFWGKAALWLNATSKRKQNTPIINNFTSMRSNLRIADVILFEGRTRVSEVIKIITLSPWTHAAIYIGSLDEVSNSKTRSLIKEHYSGDSTEPLVIESLLGFGTVVNPLSLYSMENLRICRPDGLSNKDQNKVVCFASEHLGIKYDVRQILDLARFLFPYSILPREWRSSLFQHNAGKPTAIVCSSMIARCFQSVSFPILPIVETENRERVKLHKRNFRLFTPSDFDYSPYFKVVKFPNLPFSNRTSYRDLPWGDKEKKSNKNTL